MYVQKFALAGWIIAAAIAGSYAMSTLSNQPQPTAAKQTQSNDVAHRGSGRITVDGPNVRVPSV
jgi:hypothetical protein